MSGHSANLNRHLSLWVTLLWLAACGDRSPGHEVFLHPDVSDVAGATDLRDGLDPGPEDAAPPPDDATSSDLPEDRALPEDPGEIFLDVPGPFAGLDPTVCRSPEPADLRGFDPALRPFTGAPILQDKGWFLLGVLDEVPEAREAIAADPVIAAISAERDAAFRQAATSCGADADCHWSRLAWTDEEAATAATELARVLRLTNVAAVWLRPSGRLALHGGLPDDALIATALREALTTLGDVFQHYARGRADLGERVASLSATHPDPMPFYGPLLRVALDALEADGRNEAARYEPLDQGENAPALARLATIHWDEWRFAAILVPGWGPTDLETPLSPIGREHCDIAVQRWQSGVAPFLLLSGGHVHPDRTPYAEAIEMKRYLREAWGVPEEAILVDPHARHTTTNLRNAARVALRAGIPPDQPLLISTDALQVLYISALGNRCNEELGYLPYRRVELLSEEDACLLVDARALHADARDPLDT